jgi:DNA-directed RNA polymerase specialized sigma24 family protein
VSEQWLEDLFERERPRLRAVAYRVLGSADDAEDAVQEAWLRLALNSSVTLGISPAAKPDISRYVFAPIR